MFVDADEEEFEDNPEEYIRRDIEGSGKMNLETSLTAKTATDLLQVGNKS